MIALSLSIDAGKAASAISILLDSNVVDDNASQGHVIGNLSVSDGKPWSFSLSNDAGGMFALSGSALVVGLTPLDHEGAPAPEITVSATSGSQTMNATISLNVRRPLPTLPLAAGARVAAIGDSQIAFNTFQSGSVSAEGAHKNALGFITHTQSLDPRFRWDNWYEPSDPTGRNLGGGNQGVMGDHVIVSPSNAPELGGIVGRLPAVLARKPDIIILEGGTNTISTGDGGDNSAALVIRSLERMLTLTRNEGIHAILMTIYPRASWKAGDPKRHAILQEVNAWIRSQSGRDGLLAVLDADPILLAESGEVDVSKFQGDQIHLNIPGALAVAKHGLLPILQAAVAQGAIFEKDPTIDNLLAASRGNLAGAGGTAGGNTSGSVATGYTIASGFNTSAIIASKEVIAGELEAQVIDITPSDITSGTAYGSVTFTPAVLISPAIVAGDWVQAFIHIETDASDALALSRWQVAVRQGSTIRVRSYGHNASSGNFISRVEGDRSFWVITEPLQVPSDVTFDRIYTLLELFFDKAASPFRVKVSRPIVRKVPDPRQAWGY